MTSPVITVRDEMSVEELARFLSHNMISGAPVLDQNGKPIGIVTLSDIVRNEPRREYIIADQVDSDYILRDYLDEFGDEELAGGYHIEEGVELRVRDIMTPFIYRVNEDTPVKEISETMMGGRIHRLFVTRAGEMVGVVTALDVLKALTGRMTNER